MNATVLFHSRAPTWAPPGWPQARCTALDAALHARAIVDAADLSHAPFALAIGVRLGLGAPTWCIGVPDTVVPGLICVNDPESLPPPPSPAPIPALANLARVANPIPHARVDDVLAVLDTLGASGAALRAAIDAPDGEARLTAAEAAIVAGGEPALISGLFLCYRETGAYARMVSLHDRMPPALRRVPGLLEQRAFAENRLAGRAEPVRADAWRRAAKATLARLPRSAWTTETWALLGRIHKDAARAPGVSSGARARALAGAIRAYRRAWELDLRDYFPAINLLTMLRTRGGSSDERLLQRLLPAVRVAVEHAAAPRTPDEANWQLATRLELACIAGDHRRSRALALRLRETGPRSWWVATTIGNLRLLTDAGGDHANLVAVLAILEAGAHPAP